MLKIYTKTGDDGTTGLLFGGRVAKDSVLVHLTGTVDEAQAVMGMARAEAGPSSELDRLLTSLERDLYVLMAEVTTAPSSRSKLKPGTTLVTEQMVESLEGHIDDLISRIEMPTEFVIPGANRASAALDLARTVVRRAERLAVAEPIDGSLVGQYLNRLSDLLWTLARWTEGDLHLLARTSPRGNRTARADAGTAGERPTRAGRGGTGISRRGRAVMIIEAAGLDTLPADVVAVGVPVTAHENGPQFAVDPSGLAGRGLPQTLDPDWCKRHGFAGKVGQTQVAVVAGPPAAEGDPGPPGADIILVGVGEATGLSGALGMESLRRASAAFVRAVGRGTAAALLLPGGEISAEGDTVAPAPAASAVASAVAEGAALTAYRYDDFRTGDEPDQLGRFTVVSPSPSDIGMVADGVERGTRLAEAVNLARDLVNEPPSSLTPTSLADTFVRRFADVAELSVEVWDEGRIVEERLGGLLGVARGSSQPPRLVRVEYQPADPIEVDGRVPHLALVGKGITFDSGGLSLKTATGMETMKTDMGGAAAVLAAVGAAAALGSRIRITAITPLTENMPGGSAIKPGDVLTTRKGKTIEVLNTDAEGRLVLSDGLTLAVESEPDAIIDLATLTGAAIVALGKDIAGLLGNDQALIDEVHGAGDRAGEPNWPLPLPDDYRSHIDSEVADMRNVGRPGQAGSIAAAMLLREFVGTVPWVHLDIAGPARSDENSRYLVKGGTGFGVRTLVELTTTEGFARCLASLGG